MGRHHSHAVHNIQDAAPQRCHRRRLALLSEIWAEGIASFFLASLIPAAASLYMPAICPVPTFIADTVPTPTTCARHHSGATTEKARRCTHRLQHGPRKGGDYNGRRPAGLTRRNTAPLPHDHTVDGYDLVSGYKQKRYDPPSKTIPTKLFNATARRVSGIHNLHDFNCGLKAYRGEVVKHIEVYGDMHRYIPYLAKLAGFHKIGEKVVHHQARKVRNHKIRPRPLRKRLSRPGHTVVHRKIRQEAHALFSVYLAR